MEMTKSEMTGMRSQVDSAMAQMQQQLANLPPEQRRMMEQMMQGRGMPGMTAPPQVVYRQTGSDKVGQWSCTKYEGTANGQKVVEVCTVDPKEFELSPADFDVARQLTEFMKTLLPEAAEGAFMNGTVQDQGFAGVPVRRTSFRDGAVESVTETAEFRKEAIPAAVFETPAGFRKEAMPGMGGRR
jgi:hypothetical protein